MRLLLIAALLPCAALAQDGGFVMLPGDGGELRWQSNNPDAGVVTLSFKACNEPSCGDPEFKRRYDSPNSFISYSPEPPPAAPKVKPKISQPGSTLRVHVGETVVVALACRPNRWSANNNPWDLAPMGGNLAALRGFEPGHGSVFVWCADEKRITYRIEISPAE